MSIYGLRTNNVTSSVCLVFSWCSRCVPTSRTNLPPNRGTRPTICLAKRHFVDMWHIFDACKSMRLSPTHIRLPMIWPFQRWRHICSETGGEHLGEYWCLPQLVSYEWTRRGTSLFDEMICMSLVADEMQNEWDMISSIYGGLWRLYTLSSESECHSFRIKHRFYIFSTVP